MSNLTVKTNNAISFTEEQIKVLKDQIAKDASDSELKSFMFQCQRTGLDPFTRQIYFMKDKSGKMTVMTSIDGFRLIAERSGDYCGQTKAEWCGQDGVWVDIWLKKEPPAAARVGVYRTAFKEPLYAVAIFDEYAQRYAYDDKYGKYKAGDLTFMWNKMPSLMIAKVAEALSLRKGFPNEMSGIYTGEEMAQAIPAHEEKEILPVANPLEKIENVKSSNLGDYIVKGGKYKDQALKDIDMFQLDNYVTWMKKSGETKPLSAISKEFVEYAEAYLCTLEAEKQDDELNRALA